MEERSQDEELSSAAGSTRRKFSARFSRPDEDAIRRASTSLFLGNVSRFIESSLIELAYELGIQEKPAGFRKPVPMARAEDLRSAREIEGALRDLIEFERGFSAALRRARKSSVHRGRPQTFAELVAAIRSFPAPSIMRSESAVEVDAADGKPINFSLTDAQQALATEMAARLFPTPDRRSAPKKASTEGVGSLTDLVTHAVRRKIDALGMRAAGALEPAFTDYPPAYLISSLSRHIEEPMKALLVAYRAVATALSREGHTLPPSLHAQWRASSDELLDLLLAIRVQP